MILAVGERLRRSYDYTLAGVYAQRVEVLHVADGDTVVITVAHNLILYLLPTLKALLNQHLRREREGFLGQTVKLLLIVAEAAAQASEGVSRTDYHGIAKLGCRLAGLLYVFASLALDGLNVNLVKALNEELAVFSVHDGLHGRAKHTHAILLEHAALIKLDAAVERRLSSE